MNKAANKQLETLGICVNDQRIEVPVGCTVASLVTLLKLRGGPVAVELNQELVPASQHATTILKNDDRLEVVSLTGGG